MCWWRDKDERQHRDQQTTAQIRSNPAPQQHAIISGTCTPTLGHQPSNRLTRAHTLCMLWAIGWVEYVTDLPIANTPNTSPKNRYDFNNSQAPPKHAWMDAQTRPTTESGHTENTQTCASANYAKRQLLRWPTRVV